MTVPRAPRSIMGMWVWPSSENSCVALVPELLDRRRQWFIGRDILGVAGGRAVVQLDDPALAFKPAAGRQAAQEVPGVVTQVSRFPAPQSQHLPPLDDPAVVVAADAGNSAIPQLGHDGIRLAAIADQIAQANDLIDGELLEPGERRLERADVAVDVSDESKPHGIESVQGLVVNWSVCRVAKVGGRAPFLLTASGSRRSTAAACSSFLSHSVSRVGF